MNQQSQTRIRQQVKQSIDTAIASGIQPKAPKSGIGLVLPTGVRSRVLYDKKGLTSAGKYYYEKSGLPQPGQFNYQQDPVRSQRGGRSQYIKLLDGTQRKISTWDNLNREWKLTKLGKTFYSKAVDRYTVLWPVRIMLTRFNGSIFERED